MDVEPAYCDPPPSRRELVDRFDFFESADRTLRGGDDDPEDDADDDEEDEDEARREREA